MRFTKTTLAGTAMMGLLAVGAPAAQAASAGTGSAAAASGGVKVSATAHIRYTVKGRTAFVTPYVTGTQHLAETPEGVLNSWAVPMSFGVTLPKEATFTGGGNAAGDGGSAGCTTKGSSSLSSAPLSVAPLELTFVKPGAYPVTLDVVVYGDPGHSILKKTVNVVIPTKGAPGPKPVTHTAVPSAPVTHATSRPGTHTPTGPKVQTDGASSSDGTRNAALGLGLLGVGGAAAGALGLLRRRS